eukprot:3251998-Amphidinium_carterae.1
MFPTALVRTAEAASSTPSSATSILPQVDPQSMLSPISIQIGDELVVFQKNGHQARFELLHRQ